MEVPPTRTKQQPRDEQYVEGYSSMARATVDVGVEQMKMGPSLRRRHRKKTGNLPSEQQ